MSAMVSARDARQGFSEYVSRVAFGKERLVVTRNRKELVAIVPLEDLELLEQLEDRALLQEARKALLDVEMTSPWSDVRAELGL